MEKIFQPEYEMLKVLIRTFWFNFSRKSQSFLQLENGLRHFVIYLQYFGKSLHHWLCIHEFYIWHRSRCGSDMRPHIEPHWKQSCPTGKIEKFTLKHFAIHNDVSIEFGHNFAVVFSSSLAVSHFYDDDDEEETPSF